MCDVDNEKPPFKADLAKLDAFLAKNTTTARCPFCECEDWTMPVASNVTINALPWGKINGSLYLAGLPVLTMVCKKCFFVRMMSLHEPEIVKQIGEGDGAESL